MRIDFTLHPVTKEALIIEFEGFETLYRMYEMN
jgi:hypothetical protein